MPKISARLSQLNLYDQNQVPPKQLGLCRIHGNLIGRSEGYRRIIYPLDSEKLMLALQKGLSKNQVSNWFINVHVRLWIPMIEEMNKDEFRELSTESDQLLASSCIGEGAVDSAQNLN